MIPVYLSTAWRYAKSIGTKDVQDIIDLFAIEIVASGWTDLGSYIYKSPADLAGRQITIQLTRFSATFLKSELKDFYGTVIAQKGCYISAAVNCYARIYTGPYHYCIDIEWSGATGEAIWGGVLDTTPEPLDRHDRIVFGNGSRVNSNGLYYQYSASQLWGLISGTVQNASVTMTTIPGAKTRLGFYVVRPYEIWNNWNLTYDAYKFAGRFFQAMLFFAPNQLAEVSFRTDPDDETALATFTACAPLCGSWALCFRSG